MQGGEYSPMDDDPDDYRATSSWLLHVDPDLRAQLSVIRERIGPVTGSRCTGTTSTRSSSTRAATGGCTSTARRRRSAPEPASSSQPGSSTAPSTPGPSRSRSGRSPLDSRAHGHGAAQRPAWNRGRAAKGKPVRHGDRAVRGTRRHRSVAAAMMAAAQHADLAVYAGATPPARAAADAWSPIRWRTSRLL